MKKIGIIGAGPSGLDLAVELVKKGVDPKKIVIYDNRAGQYTRPGVLDSEAFQKRSLAFNYYLGKPPHIKDFERKLYDKARGLGIRIEKHNFVELNENGVGISINGAIQEVEADYVFDCTGRKRKVVSYVNRIDPQSPMQLSIVVKPPVPNHFIAYVKMDPQQLKSLMFRVDEFHDLNTVKLSAADYTNAIVKLQALGWNKSKFPRCVVHLFGKSKAGESKVCLYFQAPDNLDKNNYDRWVETALEAYVPGTRYEKFPTAAANKPDKPRFDYFSIGGEELNQVAYKGTYQGKPLPWVIGLGDVQIDFDYYLGHGISDGLDRTTALMDCLRIKDGEIAHFDAEKYMRSISGLLREHREALLSQAKRLKEGFAEAEDWAQKLLGDGIPLVDPTVRAVAEHLLLLSKAKARMHELADPSDMAFFLSLNLTRLKKLHKFWLHTVIPEYSNATPQIQAQLHDFSKDLALYWKEMGSFFYRWKKCKEAISAYKKALDIYRADPSSKHDSAEELAIYSNLFIVCLKNSQLDCIVDFAPVALEIYNRATKDYKCEQIYIKIITNWISALCTEASNKNSGALYLEAMQQFDKNQNIIPETHIEDFKKKLAAMKALFESVTPEPEPEPEPEPVSYANQSYPRFLGGQRAEPSGSGQEEQRGLVITF